MRNARVCGLVLALALAGAGGCKRHPVASRATDEGALERRRPTVAMSDARAASQLVSGFHSVEDGSWRWTERQFSIDLARPPLAEQKGAMLTVRLTVTPVSIEKLKSLQLTPSVNGAVLEPETYTAAGTYVYRRELSTAQLVRDPVRVNFSLDKAIPPGNPDIRELGVIVLSIGLQTR